MAGVYAATFLFLVISTCSKCALSLYSSDLYSLDGGEVALTLPRGDDIIESISLSNPSFFFFGSNYSDLHVSCPMSSKTIICLATQCIPVHWVFSALFTSLADQVRLSFLKKSPANKDEDA